MEKGVTASVYNGLDQTFSSGFVFMKPMFNSKLTQHCCNLLMKSHMMKLTKTSKSNRQSVYFSLPNIIKTSG